MRLAVILLGAFALSLNTLATAQTDASTLAMPCVACHGMDGGSSLAGSANLAGQNAPYLLRQLKLIRSGERAIPLMAGQVDNMTDEQLEQLAEHYAAMPPIRGQAQEEGLAEGEAIYRDGIAAKGVSACIACHAPGGAGNALAGYPLISGQPVDYVTAQLTAYREGQRATDAELGAMMREVAANLNDREIQAVANYIRGLH